MFYSGDAVPPKLPFAAGLHFAGTLFFPVEFLTPSKSLLFVEAIVWQASLTNLQDFCYGAFDDYTESYSVPHRKGETA